jgi:uncharacterized protein YdhG (YjbR/CyaY superfamily)
MAVATKKPSRKAALKANKVFTAEEREAMEAAVADRKRGKVSRESGEAELLTALNKLSGEDRTLGERVHAIVSAAAPELWPRTWYGMPAYALGEKIVCFFQPGGKFKARYATLGFTDKAQLDDGRMWPNSYAISAIGTAEEAKIKALLKKAIG